jgi:hypothetical protein
MFKKIFLSAAALSGLVLCASQADAHYGYGYGYSHYRPHYSYSYYQPHCYSVSRPVTISVWDDYSCEVRLSHRLSRPPGLQLADRGSPSPPHAWANRGLLPYPSD